MTQPTSHEGTQNDPSGSIFLQDFWDNPPRTKAEVDAVAFRLMVRGISGEIGLERTMEVHEALESIQRRLGEQALEAF